MLNVGASLITDHLNEFENNIATLKKETSKIGVDSMTNQLKKIEYNKVVTEY